MPEPTPIITARQAFLYVHVIDLAGELASSAEAALFQTYQRATSDGAKVIILNFRHLVYKNSTGIKLLVMLLARCNAAGQRLLAAEMSDGFQEIFQVAQLDQKILVYGSEVEALQAAHEMLSGTSTPAPPANVGPGRSAVMKRSTDNWAKPVERLNVNEIPAGAKALNVHGRRLFGPLQGFGQLWQKTYKIELCDRKLTPHKVIEVWKQVLPRLKPPTKRFYPSSAGITPNELVLIDAETPGGPISTGVMVLYAGAESFTLMTPAGHPEAGWVTFSSYLAEDRAVAQVQVMARAGDPLYELAFRFAGSKLQDGVWIYVLTALAKQLGTSGEIQKHKTLLDAKLQWGRASNIWYNAQLRTLLHRPIEFVRWAGSAFRRGPMLGR